MRYDTGKIMEEVLEVAVGMTGRYPIGKTAMLQIRDVNTRSGISSVELSLGELALELSSYAENMAKHIVVRNHLSDGPLMYVIAYTGKDVQLIHTLKEDIANLERKIAIKKEKLRIALSQVK